MNKKSVGLGLIILLFFGSMEITHADIVDFENLYDPSVEDVFFMPSPYEGFNWNSMLAYPDLWESPSYQPIIVGTVSGIVTQYGGGFSVPEGGSFDLQSVIIVSVYSDVQNVVVSGYRDGDQLYNIELDNVYRDSDPDVTGYQNVSYSLNFTGVDRVTFGGSNTAHLVIDQIIYENLTGPTVPVPSAILLLASGITGLVGLRRRQYLKKRLNIRMINKW